MIELRSLGFRTLALSTFAFGFCFSGLALAGGGGVWSTYPVVMDAIEFSRYECHERSGHWGAEDVYDCSRESGDSLQVEVVVGPGEEERAVRVRGASLSALGHLFEVRGYACNSAGTGSLICDAEELGRLGSPRVVLRETGLLSKSVRVWVTYPSIP